MNKYKIVGLAVSSIQYGETPNKAKMKHLTRYWDIPLICNIERPELSHNDDDRIIKEILPIITSGKQISSIYYIQAAAGLLRLTSNPKKQYILTGWFMKGKLIAKRIKEYTGIEVLVEH